MELTRANEQNTKLLLDFLIEKMDKFLDEHPQISDVDVFMAVHNLHVVTVLSQEEAFATTSRDQLFFRKVAMDTFNKAMENKPPFKQNKKRKRKRRRKDDNG